MDNDKFIESINKLKNMLSFKNQVDNSLLQMFHTMTPQQLNAYKGIIKMMIDVNDPLSTVKAMCPQLVDSMTDEEKEEFIILFQEFINS